MLMVNKRLSKPMLWSVCKVSVNVLRNFFCVCVLYVCVKLLCGCGGVKGNSADDPVN